MSHPLCVSCPAVRFSVAINMDKVITVFFFLLQVRVVVTHGACQLAGKLNRSAGYCVTSRRM